MVVLNDYVKNIGKHFVYSQKAIDLVQQYLNKFPRVFELLSGNDENGISISDFDENNNENNALEYLAEVRRWLQELPYWKTAKKPVDIMCLSYGARDHVLKAVNDSVSFLNFASLFFFHIFKMVLISPKFALEAKLLKLKLKWQNLYIPDFNSVFVNPCPNAVFKLLDRIVVVRSGYPVCIFVRIEICDCYG